MRARTWLRASRARSQGWLAHAGPTARARPVAVLVGLFALLGAAVVAALTMGRYPVNLGEVLTLASGWVGIGPGRDGVAELVWRVVELVRIAAHVDCRLCRRRTCSVGSCPAGNIPEPPCRSACRRRDVRCRVRRRVVDPIGFWRTGALVDGLLVRPCGGPARRFPEPEGGPIVHPDAGAVGNGDRRNVLGTSVRWSPILPTRTIPCRRSSSGSWVHSQAPRPRAQLSCCPPSWYSLCHCWL